MAIDEITALNYHLLICQRYNAGAYLESVGTCCIFH